MQTNPADDNAGAPFMWWSHAFNSDETYAKINEFCDFTNIGPLAAEAGADPIKCNEALSRSTQEMGNVNSTLSRSARFVALC